MKQFFAREFIWLIAAFMIGIPSGFIFLWMLDLRTLGEQITFDESVFFTELYLVGFISGMVSVYLLRLVRASIITIANKKKES
ncbi:hypothetical protein [Aureibacter tunicatorum]|uniref:Uncharacterized protein n=1 Tax=Aureibacter tunicatorum TaxID=866807 RepID=A0AAE3XT81_9BACT|nr:hypothetical protein [Aureibacter tunicatorum]MDR6241658.1 hypothetical protein [Aureibacter tunicatorum]BDD07356.1 hypothetical protein AUTU_48390 [Aureibacter tunicatorum]